MVTDKSVAETRPRESDYSNNVLKKSITFTNDASSESRTNKSHYENTFKIPQKEWNEKEIEITKYDPSVMKVFLLELYCVILIKYYFSLT